MPRMHVGGVKLRSLSHDANQPIKKFRSPDERWKSSNNRLSTGALFIIFSQRTFSRFALTLRSSACYAG